MKWTREELIAAVRFAFPNKFPQSNDDPMFDFIEDEMTPMTAILLAQSKTGKERKVPKSPNRKVITPNPHK
jgi:hypothetical protein